MPKLMIAPPPTAVEPLTEILHGVSVSDPYRWLEDNDSPRTRQWLKEQTAYARGYLNAIPGRELMRVRVEQLLNVERVDSIRKVGNRYFFRKRARDQEQACIYFRDGFAGKDHLLLDPANFSRGKNVAVRLLTVSSDGQLLLYEMKEGGERTGTFHLLHVESRTTLTDALPRGFLRGFAFSGDCHGFYYVHETAHDTDRNRTAYWHMLGTSLDRDQKVFLAEGGDNVQLHIVPNTNTLGFLVYRGLDPTRTDFFLWNPDTGNAPTALVHNADYKFAPYLLNNGRIVALTDRDAPNFKIVEVSNDETGVACWREIVRTRPERIQGCIVTAARILVAYLRVTQTIVDIFDLDGELLGHLPTEPNETVRLTGTSPDGGEVFFERESFTKPIETWVYFAERGQVRPWKKSEVVHCGDPFRFEHKQVWFDGKDGTPIPMFLVGRPEVLRGGLHPAVMTSYGGYGVSITPKFSVLLTFLLENGCLVALPNIRGGSEFGEAWHGAAKRRNRQVAFDDFLSAAEWLIRTGRTKSEKLAILGGSNAGLLVGVAVTQRPELFRAVLCLAPVLDMLRYHLFDSARSAKEELGTADDREDFAALAGYSPYHRVRDGIHYPATMIVSGDRDQICNPLHARKMTARLQAATASGRPIVLDYSCQRGHSPVLPFSARVEALTDRLAFLCDQLQLPS